MYFIVKFNNYHLIVMKVSAKRRSLGEKDVPVPNLPLWERRFSKQTKRIWQRQKPVYMGPN